MSNSIFASMPYSSSRPSQPTTANAQDAMEYSWIMKGDTQPTIDTQQPGPSKRSTKNRDKIIFKLARDGLAGPYSTRAPYPGFVRPAMGPTQPTVNPAQSPVNPTQSTVNPAQSTVNPTQSPIEAALSNLISTQSSVDPARAAAPRRIALVVKMFSVPAGLKVPRALSGLTDMMLEIETYDDFIEYLYETLGLYDYGGGIKQIEATTRPSTGSLSALKPWDLKDELLCEENWEAVLNVAEVQGWLGVIVKVLAVRESEKEVSGKKRSWE
ncbi:hypothetical protein Q9L58_006936 [Maublancomyces gigas]|uniref:Uncharacterized protein n=1 Tax=Discina gigas TaxID=1032678 RepID=A0ABR3GDY0_9PEZI